MIRSRRSRSIATLTVLVALSTLAGCKGGGGSSVASAPATAAPGQPVSATNDNHAPTISGAAPTRAAVNAAYSFAPSASDPDGDRVMFQIANKPSWATFNTVNGQLSGTPTLAHAGVYPNIVITASDGVSSSALPPFSITVADTASGAATGGATLSWTAPTENTDGSALTDLAGFVIVYGPSSTTLGHTVRIENPSVDTYVFQDLPAGKYYFSIKAYTRSGAESDLAPAVSKSIG
jgi:hypothetical protein